MAAQKKAGPSPATKKRFKTVTIEMCEVDNGFEISIDWSFHRNSSLANTRTGQSEYVAKTEAEALAIIKDIVPGLPDEVKPFVSGTYLYKLPDD